MTISEDRTLQRKFRYLEWAALVLTAGAQLAWTLAPVQFDSLIAISFLLLAATAIIPVFTPRTVSWRVTQLVCQTVLISLASALGAHHFYYLNLYVLAAKAALFLPRRPMLAVASLVVLSHIMAGQFALFALHNVHVRRHPEPLYYRSIVVEIQSIIYFIIALTTVTILGRVLSSERKSLSKEKALQKEVEQLAVNLERVRIAREIHDGLGHTLTSSRIQLELALKLMEEHETAPAKELLIKCQGSAGASLQEVRRALKTEKEGEFSLARAVDELVQQIKQQVTLHFEIDIDDSNLTLTLKNQIFGIIKECLTNIRKHSAADRVEILLQQQDDLASLCVRDNGKGFDPGSVTSGFGLKGLRERAEAVGATMNIESHAGQGTVISFSFPQFSGKASGTIRAF